MDSDKAIDLTHEVHPKIPTWDMTCGYFVKTLRDYDECEGEFKFRSQALDIRASAGTHIDSPAHCFEGAHDVSQIPLEQLIVPCVVIDVSDRRDERDWDATIEQIIKEKKHFDILINNAGITGFQEGFGPQDPENASLDSWRRVHAINSDGVFLGCQKAILHMKQRRGSIVNISSRSGMVRIPGAAAYAASKAAVRNHTKSVALYCCEKGYDIRCNSIRPLA